MALGSLVVVLLPSQPKTANQERTLSTTGAGVNEYETIDLDVNDNQTLQQLTYDDAGNLIATDMRGDMNCDGQINSFDVDPFVLAASDPDAYAAAYPDCTIELGDVNGDGLINAFDIGVFVNMLALALPPPAGTCMMRKTA